MNTGSNFLYGSQYTRRVNNQKMQTLTPSAFIPLLFVALKYDI
jgi:hypothetical protein